MPGYQVSYWWHLTDPVRFNKKITVKLEHGHANHLRDDWSTTAYWYQTLPGPRLDILPVEQRLPNRPTVAPPADPAPDRPLTDLQQQLIRHREQRLEAFVRDRNQWLQRRAEASRKRAHNNIEIAKDVRERFTKSLRGQIR